MKKVFVLFFALFLSVCTYNNTLLAQDEPAVDDTTQVVDEPADEPEPVVNETPEQEVTSEPVIEKSLHQVVKRTLLTVVGNLWQLY